MLTFSNFRFVISIMKYPFGEEINRIGGGHFRNFPYKEGYFFILNFKLKLEGGQIIPLKIVALRYFRLASLSCTLNCAFFLRAASSCEECNTTRGRNAMIVRLIYHYRVEGSSQFAASICDAFDYKNWKERQSWVNWRVSSSIRRHPRYFRGLIF